MVRSLHWEIDPLRTYTDTQTNSKTKQTDTGRYRLLDRSDHCTGRLTPSEQTQTHRPGHLVKHEIVFFILMISIYTHPNKHNIKKIAGKMGKRALLIH